MNEPAASTAHPLTPIPAILFLNNKGGVGKTTDASLLAEYLALIEKKRVLLIDFDGQMNLTAYWVGVDPGPAPLIHPDYDPDDEYCREHLSERSNICDIFYGKEVLPYPSFIGPEDPDDMTSPRVDVIACDRHGMKEILSNINTNSITASRLIQRLGEFCAEPGLSELYDVVIIDSGPTETPLFRAAVQASTHIITPYKPEEFSIMGAHALIESIQQATLDRSGRDEPIKFLGLLPCLVDLGRGGSHEANIENMLNSFPNYHFPRGMMITNSKLISERQSKSAKKPDSIFSLAPSTPIRKRSEEVFRHIANEVFRT